MSDKPQPLIIDGVAHYTLSSYEPVSLEILIPLISEEEIDYALERLAKGQQVSVEVFKDHAWTKKNWEGSSPLQVREATRDLLFNEVQDMVQSSCLGEGINQMTERLNQSILPEDIENCLDAVKENYPDAPQEFLYYKAVQLAKEEATLFAFAQDRGVNLSDQQIIDLLGLPFGEDTEFMDEAKREGHFESLKRGALLLWATRQIFEEADKEFVHETPEESAERLKSFKELYAMNEQFDDLPDEDKGSEQSKFKLL